MNDSHSEERYHPTPRQRRWVLGFYGERCIVCGSKIPGLDLHHVDEVKTRKDTQNFVPMCKNCNNVIEYSKDCYPNLFIHRCADPRFIRGQAEYLFARGKFARSYGCYRVAAHLYLSRRKSLDDQLECLSVSIGALRPYPPRSLLRYAIFETATAFLQAGSQAPQRWRAEFLSQIGLILADFGRFSEAVDCLVKALNMVKGICKTPSIESAQPIDIDQLIANQARRLAFPMTWAPTAAPLNGTLEDEVLMGLMRGRALFRKHGNYRGYATNTDVIAVRMLQLEGPLSARLRDLVEETLTFEARFDNDWVKGSLHSTLGFAFWAHFQRTKSKRERDLAVENLRKACGIFKSRIIPEPSMRPEFSRPDLVLKELGCDDVPLISPRRALPFTDEELRDVKNAAIGYP